MRVAYTPNAFFPHLTVNITRNASTQATRFEARLVHFPDAEDSENEETLWEWGKEQETTGEQNISDVLDQMVDGFLRRFKSCIRKTTLP